MNTQMTRGLIFLGVALTFGIFLARRPMPSKAGVARCQSTCQSMSADEYQATADYAKAEKGLTICHCTRIFKVSADGQQQTEVTP